MNDSAGSSEKTVDSVSETICNPHSTRNQRPMRSRQSLPSPGSHVAGAKHNSAAPTQSKTSFGVTSK